ncbi:MAG: stage 0 sporulation family protein [Ruminococcus flavefaciens]|nr:stage 0 sporulation family protein [Ruminococcus flavefaciens]MCM1228502.1 stage 0 sporulation family protein [Ruminococcus flavefaciens]
MKEIVGIRFKKGGKVYYFSPEGINFKVGESAVVDTVRGTECGEVVIANREIDDNALASPLKPIVRKADGKDLKAVARNRLREKDAFNICEEKIKLRGLDMSLVDVECTFDNSKMLFYFTAENRIDFRELVKDLAAVFRTRIELRQIGVRDEAKVVGGLGICGREICCKSYMGDFAPVSIKMAKEQSLSLNPTKISGTCGRLMCCLKNEQKAYDDLLKITPREGALVLTPDKKNGKVVDVNLISGQLRVKVDDSEVPVTYNRSEVQLVKNGEVKISKEEMRALKKLEE